MTPIHLFVYGTLRSDCGAVHADLLRAHFTRLGLAQVRGALFDVGGYPGLCVGQDASSAPAEEQWVIGELYRLMGSEAVFDALDDYEECGARCAPPHEYVRELLPIYFEEKEISANVYCYQLPVSAARHIACGDYRVFLAQQNAEPIKEQEALASCFLGTLLSRD